MSNQGAAADDVAALRREIDALQAALAQVRALCDRAEDYARSVHNANGVVYTAWLRQIDGLAKS